MKPRLIILSDLWGWEQAQWEINYRNSLVSKYDITFYSCPELANIPTKNITEKTIHQQFLQGGIEKAVNRLIQEEREAVTILGFSIGGTIAWQASLQGLPTRSLLLISSTRLRLETQQPKDIPIDLYYGALDTNKPDETWFNNFNLNLTLLPHQKHEMYRSKEISKMICKQLLL
jgi:hypothetical protein